MEQTTHAVTWDQNTNSGLCPRVDALWWEAQPTEKIDGLPDTPVEGEGTASG